MPQKTNLKISNISIKSNENVHETALNAREPQVENQLAFLNVHITKTKEDVETKNLQETHIHGLVHQ